MKEMKFEIVARWIAIIILTLIFGFLFYMVFGVWGCLISPLLIAIIDVSCGIGRESPLFSKVKKKLNDECKPKLVIRAKPKQENCPFCHSINAMIYDQEHDCCFTCNRMWKIEE